MQADPLPTEPQGKPKIAGVDSISMDLHLNLASLVAQLVKNLLVMQGPWIDSWVGKICWRRVRLPTAVFLGFPGGSAGKESACNWGDLGSIPGLERSPEERNTYPLRYSGMENSMNCIVHGVAKSQTQLSDFHFS